MTIHKITKDLNHMVNKLRKFTEHEYKRVQINNATIAQLNHTNVEINQEIDKADKIIKNISELLGE